MTRSADRSKPGRQSLLATVDRSIAASRLLVADDNAPNTSITDAVACLLDAIYDACEALRLALPKGTNMDAHAVGDRDGETALALAFARGEKTHAVVKVGVNPGFGETPFGWGPFGGGWAWSPLMASRPKEAQRAG